MNRPSARSRFAGITIVFFLLALGAQSATAKDNWIRIRSRNFNLVGNCGPQDLRKVAIRLEQFRDVVTGLFPGARFENPVPTTVIVFKSLSSYKPFNPGGNAGYFQKGDDVNYITLTTELEAQSTYSIIYHEYVHLLLHNTSGNVPSWFDEGLAEYYSSFDIDEDRKARLGELLPYHLRTLREERFLPLRTLFAVDRYSPYYNESGKRGVFYAESWALVHYLLLGNNGQRLPQLGNFLDLLAANHSIDKAVKQAFQTDLETLEIELRRYVEGNNFKMQVATFERKLDFDTDMETTPITEAEAQADLGDLLLHTNRLTEAEIRLQQALALDPNLTTAHASLGILRARQSRFDEAKQALRAAVAGNSQNYLAHYYYAYALSREPMDAYNYVQAFAPESAAIMRAELKKAIELSPKFSDSYSLLAFVDTVTGENLDEAIQLLQRALELAPGRQELSLQLAQIYLRQKKFDLAKQTLEPLRTSNDRQLAKQSEIMFDSITRLEQQREYVSGGNANATGASIVRPAAEEDAHEKTESEYLQETLRTLEAGEQRIQGLFTKLECDDNGVALFFIQSGNRTFKLRASALNKVHFTAYVAGPREVTCGVRKQPENVLVTFRPRIDAKTKTDGEALAMDMMPKDFRLQN